MSWLDVPIGGNVMPQCWAGVNARCCGRKKVTKTVVGVVFLAFVNGWSEKVSP
jgi:hypothetical protein